MRLNSFDEWSQLREIVVGSGVNYTSHERELSFDMVFHDNLTGLEWFYPRLDTAGSASGRPSHTPIKQRYVDELNEDLEGIVKTLESSGVRVLRPMDVAADTTEVRTPAWSAAVVPPLNVRDNTLILGDEIIETPPMIRSRYFETQFLTPIFAEYFRQGARWTVMPRPLMTDASFDPSYVNREVRDNVEPIGDPRPSPYDVGFEMMIDAAQCLRIGRDVIVNVATVNHELGCDWLERHLEGRFRIHRVHRLTDSHIDSWLIALRPGTLLVRSADVADLLPDGLRNWDMIVPPEPDSASFPDYDSDDLVITSPYIDLNVLSIDQDTVMVNAHCPALMKCLEGHGFTVVPVQHRHRRLFGGGFHCFTLDTVRAGGAEDYLG